MQIEELIRETLQKMKIESEQQKENKKHVKMLNKVGKTWHRLTEDSLNQKLGEC